MSELKNIDVYIVSWGGVGTTSFMKWLQDNNIKVNNLSDTDSFKPGDQYGSGIKHIPHPLHHRLAKYKINKAIFIYDDVINSIVSLWKRNYQSPQVKKLTGNRNEIPREWTLQDYVSNNEDLFEFQQMYENWTETEKPYDCLFIKGQEIYKHRFHILKFLNLPIKTKYFHHHFRNNEWTNDLEPSVKEGLYNMYGGFNDFILCKPDIQIQKKNSIELINLTVSSNKIKRIY
tara:strand:+ start:571 stop:1263 length:693 start_codon:yes stop_codon:yes gene_type:complete